MNFRTRTIAVAATLAALLLGYGTMPASAAEGSTAPRISTNGSWGHVVNFNSGQCLGVPGGSTVNGEGLIQWPCGTWRDHYWRAEYGFTTSAGNWYHIINYNSGQCLAVPGASTIAGTQVIQWPCGTWHDHYWRFEYEPNGSARIINYNSGQCLAVPGASTTAGEKVIQWPCGPWADHFWW
jgi:hypothetical protein